MSTHSKWFQGVRAVLIGLLLFSAGSIQAAYVNTSADITLSNLQISFDNLAQGAEPLLLWTDTWYGTVQSGAQQAGYAVDGNSDDLLSDDGDISVSAQSGQVSSQADYSVSSADPILGKAQSTLTFNTPYQQGDGAALTTFDNFFTIVNQNDLEDNSAIDVLITLDFMGQLHGDADPEGYFSAALSAIFTLEQEVEDGFFISLYTDFFADTLAGSNTTIDYQGQLTIPFTLNYNTEYWLYAEADTNIYGSTIPEPDTLFLFLIGFAFMALPRWRKSGGIQDQFEFAGSTFLQRRQS